MARRRERKEIVAEINVVPYIDVMLVLLIIFMVAAPLLTQGVKINMPEAQAKAIETKDQMPIIVAVDAQGRYYLNIAEVPELPMPSDKLVTRVAAELAIALKKGSPRSVYVKGDKEVGYGKVVNAMVLLQQAGVEEVGLLTQPPEES